MAIRFDDIGNRLRAYRLGRGLTAEEVARKLGISRAAVYRIEGGGVVKIETLDRLAELLAVSAATLLGVGVEYYTSSIAYFERMRQIEELSDQVIAHFPPLSYLLTSEHFPPFLRKSLIESIPDYAKDRRKLTTEIDTVVGILEERKEARIRRRLSVVNFVSLPEIERWVKLGVIGHFGLGNAEILKRRAAAQREIEHLIELTESGPMGIQIGLIEETLPNITFQLFRTAQQTYLGMSPFRLGGDLPNVRMGVAILTTDAEPVAFYEKLAEELWARAHKGRAAAARLTAMLSRSGLSRQKMREAS
ncbi:MAG TPA: helix-turn-helix transcriptional regulator [Pseudolabrys sp.]|nr:helix-turn-helix transcriptional regulator [Pseudolabrys sp.]